MAKFDLTPFLAEPIEITVRGETVSFPAELAIPDLVRAYELNRRWQEPAPEGASNEEADAHEMEGLTGVYEFMLDLARRESPETKALPFPPSMVGRVFGVLISGVANQENMTDVLLDLITGTTAEERAKSTNGDKPKADPTRPKPKASGTRLKRRSPSRSSG